jgi:hypothetical protein
MSKRKKIKLPKDSKINKAMVETLNDLLYFSDISILKTSLTDLYLEYCQSMQDVSIHFKRNTEATQDLLRLLNSLEEDLKKRQGRKEDLI